MHGCGVIVAALVSGAAAASVYPSRPVVWIVPFAPRGYSRLPRLIAKHLTAGLRQQVVTANARLAMLPESWSGVFAPVKASTRATELAMGAAEVVAYAEQHGSRVLTGMSGTKFAAFVESETVCWGDVIRKADLGLALRGSPPRLGHLVR